MNQESTFKIKILRAFLMLFFCAFLTLSPSTTGAQTKTDQQRCQEFQNQFIIDVGGKKINTIGTLPACGEYSSFGGFVLKGINLGLAFAGIITALFIILGGYWYVTSAGNEEQAEKGRKTLTNSIIGLVVIIMSFVIVRVIATTLTENKGGSTTTSTSTSTTTPGGGNVNSGGITSAERAVLGGTVDIQQKSNGDVLVSAIINQNNVELAKKACGVNDLASGALRVSVEGDEKGAVSFNRQPTSYTASKTVSASTLKEAGQRFNKSTVKVQAYICAEIVNEASFPVTN